MSERRWFSLRAGASNWLWLTLVVIAVDQWTKALIVRNFEEYETLAVLPVLDFMRLHNTGMAYSWLSDASGWQRWALTGIGIGVSCAVLLWLRSLPARGHNTLAAGLSLVIGGALGNVIDRVTRGHVIDFIRVHYETWYFYVFNIADSAITIGAILLLFDMLFDSRRAKTPKE